MPRRSIDLAAGWAPGIVRGGWISTLDRRLGWNDQPRSYRLLAAVLRAAQPALPARDDAIADRSTVDADLLLRRVQAGFRPDRLEDPGAAVLAVLDVLGEVIDEPRLDAIPAGTGALRGHAAVRSHSHQMEYAMAEPSLTISTNKVCYIAIKAREFDVKDVETDPASGSNPSDDSMIEVLESHADDPAYQELQEFIDGLTEDEQIDLVALMWLGRGDGEVEDWAELRREAQRLHNDRTAAYLLAKPMLPDHLIDVLSALGGSCDAFEKDHL